MTPIHTTISIREGVRVSVLLTPALSGVAKRRGIDLMRELNESKEDPSALNIVFAKIIYCGAISAHEVAAVDNPALGEFGYTFSDILEWSYRDADEYLKTVDKVLEAFTGKTLAQYGQGAEVKKKRKGRLSSSTTNR